MFPRTHRYQRIVRKTREFSSRALADVCSLHERNSYFAGAPFLTTASGTAEFVLSSFSITEASKQLGL
jgi:hypothetical protein